MTLFLFVLYNIDMIKNRLFYFVAFLLFSDCTNINFLTSEELEYRAYLLKAGDILIKEKKNSLLGVFGHSSIVLEDNMVGDYPKFGEKFYKISLRDWLEEERGILVLRYAKINEEFRKRLLANIEKFSMQSYGISWNKKNTSKFYCSSFIWYVYYITAKEMGINLDLDSNKGLFVTPYDFIDNIFLINIFKEEE